LEYRYKKPQIGISSVDRIKRLSYEVLDKHKSKFGENFTDNKKSLDEVAIVRSKGLKNEVAGYITNFIKKENREAEFNLSKVAPQDEEDTSVEETAEIGTDTSAESPEEVIEVGVDTASQESAESPEEVIEVGVDTDAQEPKEPSEEKTE